MPSRPVGAVDVGAVDGAVAVIVSPVGTPLGALPVTVGIDAVDLAVAVVVDGVDAVLDHDGRWGGRGPGVDPVARLDLTRGDEQ